MKVHDEVLAALLFARMRAVSAKETHYVWKTTERWVVANCLPHSAERVRVFFGVSPAGRITISQLGTRAESDVYIGRFDDDRNLVLAEKLSDNVRHVLSLKGTP